MPASIRAIHSVSLWSDIIEGGELVMTDPAPQKPNPPVGMKAAPSDAENVIFDEGGTIGERRLSQRSKLHRAVSIVLLTLVTVAVVLGVPGAVLMRLRSMSSVSRAAASLPPPPTFAAPLPQLSRVPPDATTVYDIQIQPVNGLRDMGYACWIAPRSAGQGASSGPVHVSLTADAGQYWQRLPVPSTTAAFCAPTPDSADPLAALVSLTPPSTPVEPCPLPRLYFTGDRGQHWLGMPWPAGMADLCGIQLALTAHRIYVWHASPLLPAVGAPSRVIATEDSGRHWRMLGGGLAGGVNPRLIATRPSGWLLAQLDAQATTTPGETELWQSADDGASWQRLGPIPGTEPTVLLSLDPAKLATTSWGRLYAISQRNEPPTADTGQTLATSLDGSQWQTLSQPPESAVVPPHASTLSIVGVGVGSGDSLLLTRELNPDGGGIFVPARQLWRWDPANAKWLLVPYTVQTDALVDGLTWQNGQPTLWLTIVRAGVPPSITLDLDAVSAQSS
jgi:hypothetical protein